MPSDVPRGPRQILQAARYSAQGIRAAWKFESSFRAEVYLVSALLPVALLLGRTATEQGLLVAVLILVLTVELLNSGIEAIVDRVSPEIDELAGRAKDMGSAAVSGTILVLLLVWGGVIVDRFVA